MTMRIVGGIDERDPDHWRNNFGQCPVVTLNGVAVDHVREADDTAGFVVFVEYDGDRLKIDSTSQRIVTRRIDGTVQIVGERHPSSVE
jgi:hypothetical protein